MARQNQKAAAQTTANSMFSLFERIRQEGLKESALQGGIEQKTPFNQGAAGVQQTEFSEKEIQGRVDTRRPTWGPPLDKEQEKRKTFLQKTMPQIYKRIKSIKEGKDQLEDSYANNFIINYHSHQTLLPIPLQMFATDVSIVHQTESPYESATIRVNMGFDTAAVVFAGEDGHPSPGGWILIRHKATSDESLTPFLPSHLQNPRDENGLQNTAPAVFLGTVSGIDWNVNSDSNGTMQCIVTLSCNSFIHNIMQGEYATTGAYLQDELYSFYKSTLQLNPDPTIPIPSKVKLDLLTAELEKAVARQTEAQATIDAMTSTPPREEYNQAELDRAGAEVAAATEEISKLSAEIDAVDANYPADNDYLPGIPSSRDRNIIADPLFRPDGYTSNAFVTGLNSYSDYIGRLRKLLKGQSITLSNGTTRTLSLKPSEALNDMLRKFAYPVMPLSFFAEPFDIEVIFNTYLMSINEENLPDDPDEFYESLKYGFYANQNGVAGGETQIEFITQALYLGIVYIHQDQYGTDAFSRPGTVPITSGFGPQGADQFSVTDPDYFTDNPGGGRPVGRNYFSSNGGVTAPITGQKIDNYLEYAELFTNNLPSLYKGLRLGDVIHVATNRDDVPLSSELWASMPKAEQSEIDPFQFSNMNIKNTTVWGLLSGSFQYDPEIVDFYPTIIPLRDQDARRLPQKVYDNHPTYKTMEANANLLQKESGIADFRPKSSLFNPHPLWHAIGGIPTLVYRLKPMHPIIKNNISKDRIDKIRRVQDRARFGGFAVEPLQYITDFEKYIETQTVNSQGKFQFRPVNDEYVDNSYFDELPKVVAGQGPKGEVIPGYATTQNEIITGEATDSFKLSKERQNELGLTKEDKPVRHGLKKIDYEGGEVSLVDLNSVALPVFISRQEIKSLRFSQLDTLRINSVSCKTSSARGEHLTGEAAYIKSKFVTNLDSALKYGYRPYENIIPSLIAKQKTQNVQQAALTAVEEAIRRQGITDVAELYKIYTKALVAPGGDIASLYRLGAAAERLYMMMGDEQKYFRGTMTCTALLDKDIQPGMWVEVALASPDSPINPYGATGGGYGLHAGVLFVYVLGVTHEHFVDQNTGLVVAETSINFERGSIGGVIPNFPSRLDNQRIKKDKQNLRAVGREAAELEFFKMITDEIGPTIGSIKPAAFDAVDFEAYDDPTTPESTKAFIKDEGLEFFRQQLAQGNITREEYAEAVTQIEAGINPLPKDIYQPVRDLVDYLNANGITPPNKLTNQVKHTP